MQRSVDELTSGSFDVFVIGGGITGAGIALDATLRGLRVALVDKGDFASGTSSVSSKLVHGGLRYLEGREFGLVNEALRERATLLRLAPHLVRPLRILLPIYSNARRPRWLIKLGLTLYDWLAGGANIGRHRWFTAGELLAQVQGLRSDGLRGGFEFYDAQMDDARLCLEVVLTAATAGACVANYVEAVDICRDRAGRVCGCEVVDRLTRTSRRISARRVVNAAGPWVDEVCRIDNGEEPPHTAPTKGVHLVLPGIGLQRGFLVTHPDDRRVLFVLPWMNRTLVGTTDTFYDERPDRVSADAADVSYLLAAYNRYFSPAASTADVLATLAGLRPLLRSRAKQPSAVSREFSVLHSPSGLWTVAGGKYTTYRLMAEKLVDRLVDDLGAAAARAACTTATHRLIGTPDEDWDVFRVREQRMLSEQFQLDPDLAGQLIDRYGCRARTLAAEFGRDASAWSPIIPGEPYVRAELPYQAAHEMAQCPADHFLRRTRLGLFHPELLLDNSVPAIAAGREAL